jgi:hypothetical protein
MLTSLFRLLGAIYRDDELTQSRPDQNGIVLAMAALCGLGKAELRPGSPRVWDLYPGPYFPDDSLRPKTYDGGTDLVIQPPLQFYLLEITAEPDRCAYRLVRRIYECFGLGQEAIPREFDPKLGRLVLD